MAAKKVGALIKEARTNAGLSQEKLANAIQGLSAADISKAEHGEKELSQEQLKAIAKATGVTQKSLLEAAAGTSSAKTSSPKTSEKTTAKTSGKTTSASSTTSMKVSSTEKKLVELYRAADTDTKKKVMSILRGKEPESGDLMSLLEGALGQIMK